MKNEIEAVKEEYYKIAQKINAPKKYILFADEPQDFGYPHVEYIDGMYYYVVTEKGRELERKSTVDSKDLLYWLISKLTSSMAADYELSHRDKDNDFRRLFFTKHVELLNEIDKLWANKERERYNKILIQHPFSDNKLPKEINKT